jgi:PAS domain-containing protein
MNFTQTNNATAAQPQQPSQPSVMLPAGFSLQDLMRNAAANDPYMQQRVQQAVVSGSAPPPPAAVPWNLLQQLQQQAAAVAAVTQQQQQQQPPPQQQQTNPSVIRFYPQQAANPQAQQQQQMLQMLRSDMPIAMGGGPIMMAAPVAPQVLQPRRGADQMCENAVSTDQLSNLLQNIVQRSLGTSSAQPTTAVALPSANETITPAVAAKPAAPAEEKPLRKKKDTGKAPAAPAAGVKRLRRSDSRDVSNATGSGGSGTWDNFKHKESEVRRRVKIREKYEELKMLSGCKRADRRSILNDVCEKLVENDREIKRLISLIEEQDQAVYGGAPGVHGPVALVDSIGVSSLSAKVGVVPVPHGDLSKTKSEEEKDKPIRIMKSIPPCLIVPNVDPVSGASVMDAIDFQTLFQHAGVGMAVTRLDGSFVECNDNFCKVMGRDRFSLLQSNLFLQTSAPDVAHLVETTRSLIQGERPPGLPPQTHEHSVQYVNYLGNSIRVMESSITCRISLIRSFGDAKYFMYAFTFR